MGLTPTAQLASRAVRVEHRLRLPAALRNVRLVPAHNQPPVPPPEIPRTAPPPQSPPEPARQDAEIAAALRADRDQITSVLTAVTKSVSELRKDRESRLKEWQRAAIELATTIASRLLHERVAADAFPIDAKVRDMIAELGDDRPVAVRLHPHDLELLRSRLANSDDNSIMSDPNAPRFVPDPSLKRGACQVEGNESMLISSVTRELQELREELLRSVENARA